EADQIGQELMARAGFDPSAAVDLWRNMQQAGGNAPPEFLSTHPSGERRIQQLQSLTSDSMTLYRQAQAQGRKPNCRR
ncbi:MAG TPA: M48 family metalloprotease, partial [Gammaproteobacteria bacterium]|nr:M48 family metalloprotease [Gammaproteobacteria bacterium]